MSAGNGGARPLIVQVVRATLTFGGDAGLQELDLDVPGGTIFGIVGPSGSGKTTAVRIILGTATPEAGEVTVFGRSPLEFDREDRRRVGYLPQSSALYPELSLRHNLNLAASMYGLPWRSRLWPTRRGRAARRRVEGVFDLVDLRDQRRTKLRDASGGEQRRIGLAAALVHDPDLVVLDEPTAGIDPVLRRRIWDHLAALRDDGVTIIVTTQYVEEAADCDLVAVLVDGRTLAVDTPDGLRRRAFGDGRGPAGATFDDVFVALIDRHRADAGRRAPEDGGYGRG
ncbi:ABC transporter ATP-binding protein [Nitriliruptor alkaliphilus]|uniref:ABC transporter ATP-binding protein n=1 Tax=Nitriliruptor alkaliphilus TaxID=427918 RepID=UPI00069797EC|nr:ABC transporter ATP-binding protein [Nitriliruptor alkaliphilus]